ncbi:HD domain-containing protein [Egibacter rhizosphaerae]|uniref:Bifunctional uridylyltransferase/uridylyl-removing enzyme n=1 Tax=Egibacter rhizosphaerae TaxID=1670831 RepID=A0A411YIN4_9ACTN|nr:HD domain-containing protein [Egibacter rhizosphaerae]QBI21128.1 HD domain-containing protein [Egibacter rhizosphaerae]
MGPLDVRAVDAPVGRAWTEAWSNRVDAHVARSLASVDAGGVAVVALGSYARRQLCPASDVDLLLLHDGWKDSRLEELVRAVCYPLWDARLEVGYAVRTPREAVRAATERLETATALVDRRLVAGEVGLLDELSGRAQRWMRRRGGRLVTELEAVEARRRADGVAGELEPDLKRGVGGLRDVHALRWAAAGLLGEPSIDALIGAAYLSAADERALTSAAGELLALRVALHLGHGPSVRPGTEADRLRLERQDDVAEVAGMGGDGGALLRRAGLAARSIAHLHARAWPRLVADAGRGRTRLAPPAEPLEDGLVLRDGIVEAEPGRRLADDPALGLRAVAAAAARETNLGRATASAWRRELAGIGTLPWNAAARAALLAVLRRGEAGEPALADADEMGLLGAHLPDWQRIRGAPQRNPYHRYDVDTHLRRTVAELVRLVDGAEDWRHTSVWERLDDPDVLLLGAFLHDVGKVSSGDHSVVGAQIAREWLLRMGFDRRRADRVAKLVRLHLLLPETATARDLDDQDEIDRVADRVGDAPTLDALYLLALADARATGPAATSSWKDGLLADLHARVRTVLTGDPEATRQLVGPEARLEDVRTHLGDDAGPAR